MLLNRRLLALTRGVRWHIAACTLLGLGVIGTRVAQALLIANAIARMFAGAQAGELATTAAWLAATVLVRALLLWLGEQASQWAAHATKLRARERLYQHLLMLGPGYLTQNRTGEVRAVLIDGVESLETYFGRYLPALGQLLVGPVLVLLYLLTLDPLLTLIVLGAAVLTIVTPLVWQAAFAKRSALVWDELGAMDADFVDTVQGLPTLKAFNASDRRRAHLDAQAERVRQVDMGQLHLLLLQTGVQRLGTLGGFAGALLYAVAAFSGGELAPAVLLTVVFLVPEVFRPIDQLGRLVHDAFGAVSAADGIHKLLDTAPPEDPAARRRPAGGEGTRPALQVTPAGPNGGAPSTGDLTPSIRFDEVGFSYPGRERPAVDNVSFRVDPGEAVAVVGPSGSGKTTLVALLLRFFEPRSGAVRIGGVDVRDLSPDVLYGMVAVVSQDTYLFHGTIGENIAFSRPDASSDEIRAAAVAAGVDGFVADLPGGYDTPVGERGLTLSGGQRQRIAIARALLADAPILVLDEATSSVDAASEAAIQATLDAVSRERTTLVIAHRLSTIRDADRIVVLDQGAVVETGDHETLSGHDGVYAALTSAQGVMTG